MKMQKVWILPDNSKAQHPVAWVDDQNPEYQDAIKGPFIEAQAAILNGGKTFLFADDEDNMADVPAETKTIIIEKLMGIKGCHTSTTVEWTGTSENPSVSVSKHKYPQGYVFLKKPTFEGGETYQSTENSDLDMTGKTLPLTVYTNNCPYNQSADSGVSFTGETQSWQTSRGGGNVASVTIFLKLPNATKVQIARVSSSNSSAATAWNNAMLSGQWWTQFSSSSTSDMTAVTAVDYKVIELSTTLPDGYWERTNIASYFSNQIIPEGTKVVVSGTYRTYNPSTSKYSSKNTIELDLGYVYDTGITIDLTAWLAACFSSSVPAEEFQFNTFYGASQRIPTPGSTTELLTYNTPCWTFLSDVMRVKRGGKMVMKGTIRYLEYMSDLQPSGDDYRDYQPYEIGE